MNALFACRRHVAGGLLLAGGVTACARPPASPPPAANVLVVTIDTLRADHCSAYGYGRPTTPRLERLAREGVRFDAAYAAMPATGPSHATLFTSRYPLTHGVLANGYALVPGAATLAETLRARGYQTAAMVSAYPLDRKFGHAQGFDTYDQEFTEADASIARPRWEGRPLDQPYDRRAHATTRVAIAWLQHRQRDRPFFLWVHYFDPHSPYDAPEPWASRFPAPPGAADSLAGVEAAYDAEVAFADHEMGRLTDAIDGAGIASSTLVVVTADHGEGLRAHGLLEHGDEVYEEAVRVPLVLRWTGRLAAGRAVPAPVEMIDVAPTILALLGSGETPRTFRGRSLTAVLGGQHPEMSHRVFLQGEHREGPAGMRYALRAGRWKYIERRRQGVAFETELFDLDADPRERANLAADRRDEVARFSGDLRKWRKSHGGARVSPPRLSARDREAFRALGYIE